MKQKILAGFFGCCVVLLIASCRIAQAEESQTIDGAVTKISLNGKSASISVQLESGQSQSFKIEPSSTVALRQGETVALNQIQLGDMVRLNIDEKGKKPTVKSIEVI